MILKSEGLTRAFADDTATVLSNIFGSLTQVTKAFDEYAKISGLALNYSKTVIVPLWRAEENSYEHLKNILAIMGDQWSIVQIQSCTKYLVLLVGPGRDNKVWSKAINKWQQRAKDWKGTGIGLRYSAMVYNVFCVSVLLLLAQLLEIPEEIIDQEGKTMLMLASGPKVWAIKTDLWRMGNQCSLGRSFHCIGARGQAAKLRAIHFGKWETDQGRFQAVKRLETDSKPGGS